MDVLVLVDEIEVEVDELMTVELEVLEEVLVTTILIIGVLVGTLIVVTGAKGLTHPLKLLAKPRAAPAR